MMPDLWHWLDNDGIAREYELIDVERVSYPVEKSVLLNGKRVIERSKVEFSVATAKEIKP